MLGRWLAWLSPQLPRTLYLTMITPTGLPVNIIPIVLAADSFAILTFTYPITARIWQMTP